MLTVETAREQDGQAILRITAEAGVFTSTEVGCVEELWDEYCTDQERSGYRFLVCCAEDGFVLGFACYGPHALTSGTYDLYWIAVDPATRSRGVGRTLLSRVEAEVEAQGGRLLLIETSDTEPYLTARKFYQQNAYQLEATIRDFYAPGDSLVVFAKPLAVAVPVNGT